MKTADKKHINSFSIFWKIALLASLWMVFISIFHWWLNFNRGKRNEILIGYMPVITNLSAPLLDYASIKEPVHFKALKFSSFAEMGEAFRSGRIQVAFMIAPLAIVLREQGVPLKVVYVGNRNESTFVVRTDIKVASFRDLRGKTVAVPMRYSCHNLLILELAHRYGFGPGAINIVEMQPPDMASALSSGSLDAYFVGEPFAAQTVKSGKGKVLFYVEEKWPHFICNVMVIHDEMIADMPNLVQKLVGGSVRAGYWASMHLKEAAKIASSYWNQDEQLVEYALNTPPGRIKFQFYRPEKKEFQQIENLMLRYGLTKNPIKLDDLIDPSFCDRTSTEKVQNIRGIFRGIVASQ